LIKSKLLTAIRATSDCTKNLRKYNFHIYDKIFDFELKTQHAINYKELIINNCWTIIYS